MYKNPIPVLPEDEKYKEFRIQFKYKEAMTTKEAAQAFFAYLIEPNLIIAPTVVQKWMNEDNVVAE